MNSSLKKMVEMTCANLVCVATEEIPDPPSVYRLILRVFYTDSTLSLIDKTELEVRYGPNAQETENMALQMRFTCSKEEEWLGS